FSGGDPSGRRRPEPCAQRTSRGSNGQDPAHVAAGEATRWRRPAGGGEARCVAALPAPHPARPPRGRPVSGWVRSRTGRQEEPAGARRAAGRRAPPVFNEGLFGVRVRRWLAVGHSPRDRTECGETSTIGDAGSWIRRRICALCLADPRVVSASGVSYDKSCPTASDVTSFL
ncbi:hypothetical protein PVAP13_4NG188311, partial [Panicum virgatum]